MWERNVKYSEEEQKEEAIKKGKKKKKDGSLSCTWYSPTLTYLIVTISEEIFIVSFLQRKKWKHKRFLSIHSWQAAISELKSPTASLLVPSDWEMLKGVSLRLLPASATPCYMLRPVSDCRK